MVIDLSTTRHELEVRTSSAGGAKVRSTYFGWLKRTDL
jgi:hypothetical protein